MTAVDFGFAMSWNKGRLVLTWSNAAIVTALPFDQGIVTALSQLIGTPSQPYLDVIQLNGKTPDMWSEGLRFDPR